MKKIIKIGTEARTELAEGARILTEAVKSTLGPFGQNFFLDKKNTITNDGVTVAREVQLNDEVQQRGVVAIREASIKTNDEVGDATTTAVVLAYEIYSECTPHLGQEGVVGSRRSPTDLIKQIERERVEVTDMLMGMKEDITTEEQLINSAIVSVEDEELGKIIGSAQWNLGKEGVLVPEKSGEAITTVEPIKGIMIDNGYTTSQMINNFEKQTLDLLNTKVLLTSHTIKTEKDWQALADLAEAVKNTGGQQLTVIARAWSDQAVQAAGNNINKGGFPIWAINAPYEDMQEKFKDIRAVVGGSFYDSENTNLKDVMVSDVGFAKKIEVGRFNTVITGQDSDQAKERVSKRVEELKEKAKGQVSDFEKKNLARRIAQLQEGFALVKVGSSSEMERNRLYDKCEDAVNAVRVAFQEGTVKGAGLAFKEIAEKLPDSYLLKRPLMSIYNQIKKTAPADWVVEDWVRDPVKVLRVALKNACSAASTFATAGGVITAEVAKGLNEVFAKQLQDANKE